MGPNGYSYIDSQLERFYISYTNRYANGTTDDEVKFNGTAGESKADHFPSVFQPPKTDCVFTNSATCAPAETNTIDSNGSCKIDVQGAEETPYVDEKRSSSCWYQPGR